MLARGIIATVATIGLATCCSAESLDGQWMLSWSENGERPGAKAHWTPVKVPSLLGQQEENPFVWYKRSFTVPEGFAGRHVYLRFGAVRFVSEVYVNGTKVGGHYGGWEPFEVDITRACRIGQANELLVRVQDVTGVVEQEMEPGKKGRSGRFIDQAKDTVMAPVGSQYSRIGIWESVSLVAHSDVYVEDVFVKTSVRQHELAADWTLKNLSDRDERVRIVSKVEGTDVVLCDGEVTVPARATKTFSVKRPWANPRLWGPEDPHLYQLTTQVTVAGKELDATRTRFGFREFWVDGPNLVLNGTPMKFLATAGHPRGNLDDGLSKASAVDFYQRIREAGCVAMRLHANVWPKVWYEAADEVGMPIVMEAPLFCYANAYALSKPKFWENYHEHLTAMVRDHRNHPSVVMTSLENEILHCGGERVPETVHRLAEAGRLVKKLDPTRPILFDADGDPEGVADVVNLHYPQPFDKRNLWPDAGYWLETGMEVACWPRKFWTWDRKKPLYFGEFLHLQHYTEADPYTVFVGDEAYRSHDQAMALTKAMAWEMQVEAYRAAGVSGQCPWTLTETGAFPDDDNPRYLATKRAYEKNAAFCRQYDSRFYAGQQVERTMYLYNDTLHPAKLVCHSQLQPGQSAATRPFDLPSSGMTEFKLSLKMPEVDARTKTPWQVTVTSGDKRVFSRDKTYWVFPRRKLAVPQGVQIALFEGSDHTLSRAFGEAGVKVVAVTDLARLPQADVLVIGPHALDGLKPEATSRVAGDESGARQRIAAFVQNGGSVIALEQDSYDCGLLPGRLLDRGATITFPRGRCEVLFAGLIDEDFRFWRGDHVVARKTLAKPEHGRFRVLVDSGGPQGLVYVPLVEVLDGRGRYLLSQLAIGEKLSAEPVAQVLLENMLRYATSQKTTPVKLAVVQNKLPLAEKLDAVGAKYADLSGRLQQTELGPFGVLVAEADAPEVAANLAKLREFVATGGRIVLHGGTPEGLGRLASLFPEPITLQRSNAVPITIAQSDPVINGLTNQELYWYGSRKDLNYHARTPLSKDVAHYVIVAGTLDKNRATVVEAESMADDRRNPSLSMAVDRINPSYQKGHVYFGTNGSLKKKLDFPQSGEYMFLIRGRGTPLADTYPQIELLIDGRPCGSITTDSREWGSYALSANVEKGTHEVTLAFVNDLWNPETKEDRNVFLDSLTYGPTPTLQSKRLLNPAALVKAPLGKGFVLIDQVCWAEGPITEKTSRYLSNLLTNLGCEFESPSGALRIPAGQMEAAKGMKLFSQKDGLARLGTNGTIVATIRFAQSRKYRFSIRASGTEAGGQFPNVALSIDGKLVGNVSLRRGEWQLLHLEADVLAGDHKVGLAFTNDHYDPPADRNLVLGELQIR